MTLELNNVICVRNREHIAKDQTGCILEAIHIFYTARKAKKQKTGFDLDLDLNFHAVKISVLYFLFLFNQCYRLSL